MYIRAALLIFSSMAASVAATFTANATFAYPDYPSTSWHPPIVCSNTGSTSAFCSASVGPEAYVNASAHVGTAGSEIAIIGGYLAFSQPPGTHGGGVSANAAMKVPLTIWGLPSGSTLYLDLIVINAGAGYYSTTSFDLGLPKAGWMYLGTAGSDGNLPFTLTASWSSSGSDLYTGGIATIKTINVYGDASGQTLLASFTGPPDAQGNLGPAPEPTGITLAALGLGSLVVVRRRSLFIRPTERD